MTFLGTRDIPFHIDWTRPSSMNQPASRLYSQGSQVIPRSQMELLVSFHCQCRGVKFYDLRSAGAEWGAKLDLVKEPDNPYDVSRLGSLGYPVREALELDR